MVRVASVVLIVALAAGPALAADGAQVFSLQCQGCHQGSSSPAAPSLAGVYGAKIAGRSDFDYSPALKAKAGAWTAANLDAFLKGPAEFAPGSRMFISPPDDQDRVAVIGYLKTLKADAAARKP